MNLKLITSILLTALTAFTVGLFNWPWYAFAISTFLIFVAIPQKGSKSFWAAFFTILIVYACLAIKIDFDNEHLLSKKIAELFMLKDKYWVLYIVTALLGALVAGFAALSGSLLRDIFAKKKRSYYS